MFVSESFIVDEELSDSEISDDSSSETDFSENENNIEDGSQSEDEELVSNSEEEEESELHNETEEDALITAIVARNSTTQNKINPISGDDLFTDISFHPSMDVIAMSCLNGNIEIHSYGVEGNELKGSIEAHYKACRAIEFSDDGLSLCTIGKDKNIIISDVERLDMKMFIDKSHLKPLSALRIVDENLITTGDEEGVIKVWDLRNTQKAAFKSHDMHDYISCIISKDGFKIACTSGDGILTSYDLRSYKLLQQSAPCDSDLTCCSTTHNSSMIVCGTMTGQFLFYKWSDFSDFAGTYKLPRKGTINAILDISDNIVLSGLESGELRAFHFFPNQEIGIVGNHTLGIEKLDVSHDGKIVASLSPDPIVKFWDISYLEGFQLSGLEKNKNKVSSILPSSEFDDRKSFFSELS